MTWSIPFVLTVAILAVAQVRGESDPLTEVLVQVVEGPLLIFGKRRTDVHLSWHCPLMSPNFSAVGAGALQPPHPATHDVAPNDSREVTCVMMTFWYQGFFCSLLSAGRERPTLDVQGPQLTSVC